MNRHARLIACLQGRLAVFAVPITVSANEITCRPESRFECAGFDCSWITIGFQHAEFFLVDDALGTFSISHGLVPIARQ
jgi:hypothetical protein